MKQIIIAYVTTVVVLLSGGAVDPATVGDTLDAVVPDVPIPVIDQALEESDSDLSAAAISRKMIEEQNAADAAEEDPQQPNYEYLGHYKLTAYEWTGNPCANGNYPTEDYTCACNFLPLGTVLYIEGYGTYVVEDRGGMGNNIIDLYLGDPYECVQFGVQDADVYIVSYP